MRSRRNSYEPSLRLVHGLSILFFSSNKTVVCAIRFIANCGLDTKLFFPDSRAEPQRGRPELFPGGIQERTNSWRQRLFKGRQNAGQIRLIVLKRRYIVGTHARGAVIILIQRLAFVQNASIYYWRDAGNVTRSTHYAHTVRDVRYYVQPFVHSELYYSYYS